MGVHGVDKSLGSIGFMMQQTLCPTMKICSIIKKIKVALETAEIAPSAHNGRVRIAMPKYIGCSEQGRTRRGRKQWTQHLKLIQVFCQQHPAVIVSVWHEPAVQDAFDDEHINGVVRSKRRRRRRPLHSTMEQLLRILARMSKSSSSLEADFGISMQSGQNGEHVLF
jgi:hypothetical protein